MYMAGVFPYNDANQVLMDHAHIHKTLDEATESFDQLDTF